MIIVGGRSAASTTPPHDVINDPVAVGESAEAAFEVDGEPARPYCCNHDEQTALSAAPGRSRLASALSRMQPRARNGGSLMPDTTAAWQSRGRHSQCWSVISRVVWQRSSRAGVWGIAAVSGPLRFRSGSGWCAGDAEEAGVRLLDRPAGGDAELFVQGGSGAVVDLHGLGGVALCCECVHQERVAGFAER
jgi:hypothetical protein